MTLIPEVIPMAATSKPWTRWQDFAEVVLGLVAFVSSFVIDMADKAMWAMLVLGALIALDGVLSLAMPDMVYAEYIQIGLGVLLFIAPFVMSFTGTTAAAWLCYVLGALTVVAGFLALPEANAAHTRAAGSH
jgi:uncharacterized membrane protein HdeD (DUF308 family)